MYLDIAGAVTTGVGCKIDPCGDAIDLPWALRDGTPVGVQSIVDEWKRVKSLRSMAQMGGGAFAKVTTLRLPEEAVRSLFWSRVAVHEHNFVNRAPFMHFDSWPADAQMGLLSMSFAMGAEKFAEFPKFCAAAARQDWATCANECKMRDADNPGVRPRNAADLLLFQNAAAVDEQGLDPEILHWPDAVAIDLETDPDDGPPEAA
jgi:hypothetical protein